MTFLCDKNKSIAAVSDPPIPVVKGSSSLVSGGPSQLSVLILLEASMPSQAGLVEVQYYLKSLRVVLSLMSF